MAHLLLGTGLSRGNERAWHSDLLALGFLSMRTCFPWMGTPSCVCHRVSQMGCGTAHAHSNQALEDYFFRNCGWLTGKTGYKLQFRFTASDGSVHFPIELAHTICQDSTPLYFNLLLSRRNLLFPPGRSPQHRCTEAPCWGPSNTRTMPQFIGIRTVRCLLIHSESTSMSYI